MAADARERQGEESPASAAASGAVSRASQGAPGRLERLQSVTDSALGYMSLEEMLSELLERIRGAMNADTAALLLLDEDRNVLVARAARGLEEEVRQGVQIPLARGFAGRVAAQRRPIIIEDLSRAEVVNPILRQRGIRSLLGVPVHVEGRLIGVMHIGTLQRRAFNEDDVALLQSAADRAALAIDNARLSEQRAVTEIMQRTLLPDELPQVPGIRMSAKYLPADSGVKIGGDWYDVFQLANGRLTLVIGDVVGRGVIAASVMSEIRIALRAYLMEGHRLAEVMALLNELLVAMGRSRSATAALLEFDLERGELEVVSAAHLPPLHVEADGSSEFLDIHQGMPLGVSSRAEYASRTYPFSVGSTLMLYTDGLIERRGEPIDEGLKRLQAAAKHAATAEDASFADRAYRALIEECALDDDIAMLAIESLPLGASMELTLEAHPRVLTGLRSTLGRWLLNERVAEDALFDITLAASEAASNAIEHAYRAEQASFVITCEHEDDAVRITIRDSGRWRDARSYGRGRGLGIMRALMDSVQITRAENGTTVTLTKHLPGGGS